MSNPPYGMVLLGGLFAWGIYRRIRRNIGRQPLRPGRIIVSMVILSLVSLAILATGLAQPVIALSFAAGAGLGVAGAFVGLRHTRFETTEQGHFYTPNTYIGIALTALLLGRMGWRLFRLQDEEYAAAHHGPGQSPLTFGLVGLTVGYYLAYYIGLFIHTRDRR